MVEGDISPRMRKMLERGRAQARDKIIERGIVQFRADPELMSRLLLISDTRKLPLGTMLRNWIVERLDNEEMRDPSVNIDALADKISAAVICGLHVDNAAVHVVTNENVNRKFWRSMS